MNVQMRVISETYTQNIHNLFTRSIALEIAAKNASVNGP